MFYEPPERKLSHLTYYLTYVLWCKENIMEIADKLNEDELRESLGQVNKEIKYLTKEINKLMPEA